MGAVMDDADHEDSSPKIVQFDWDANLVLVVDASSVFPDEYGRLAMWSASMSRGNR